MKLLKILTLIILTLPLWMTGCIGDDLSDCPPVGKLTLSFSYPNFDQRISGVTVGVYDSNKRLVDYRRVNKTDLDIFRGIALNLNLGDYTAVCWANAFDNTQIEGTNIGDLLSGQEVAHPGYFNNSTIPSNDALFYGIHTFSVLADDNVQNETVAFTPAHIRLVVQLKGLESTQEGAPTADYPYIRVNNLEPAYDYTMTSQGGPKTYYPGITTVEPTNKLVESDFNVLRFGETNPITIEVMENKTTNNVLHTVDLQTFIAAHNIEIEDGKEVTIPIEITFDGSMNVIIEGIITDWGDKPITPLPQH